MRRCQKWLSVGLLAVTPGAAMAGLIGNGESSTGSASRTSAAAHAASRSANSNQELAQRVARALKKAKLNGYDIQIDVRDGVVTLDGMVGSRDQQVAASKISKSISGVAGVNNRLRVGDAAGPHGAVQQAAATMPRRAANPNAVRQANYQSGHDGRGEIQQASAMQGMPAAMLAQTATPPVAMPAYGPPDSFASHAAYNQPNLPNYSWPTYAQYPNYAAITYPSQYSASAWPYIGPFYPYPQVPLNWRKATLEWNEGNWNLSFDSKTNRWWWFLNPNCW